MADNVKFGTLEGSRAPRDGLARAKPALPHAIVSFVVGAADEGATVAAALRRHLNIGTPGGFRTSRDGTRRAKPDGSPRELRQDPDGASWAQVRRLCTTGKVFIDDERALDPAARVRVGQTVSVKHAAPRPDLSPPGFRIVFDDAHLVVIDKPSGISSVPFDRKETGTAMDLVRGVWRRRGKRSTATPLYVVHRIDKDTSGLLCFAKTRLAERALHAVFQRHTADRFYLAVAEGDVGAARIESHLVADRGDGIRGSARNAGQREHAQEAVTFVEPLRKLPRATLCRVRLETGRTHQIRIHLAERGHPIVGETVYIRDLLRAGRTPLSAPRLMLHAARLGFPHPVTGTPLEWTAAPPADFVAIFESLGGARGDL